jgi:hypothetical protein
MLHVHVAKYLVHCVQHDSLDMMPVFPIALDHTKEFIGVDFPGFHWGLRASLRYGFCGQGSSRKYNGEDASECRNWAVGF